MSIMETLNELNKKRAELDETYKELERSVRLHELWTSLRHNDVFAHGPCSTKWTWEESKFSLVPRDNVYFVITRGDGSSHSVPWKDVPDFFKHDEAARRGITVKTKRESGKLNNPENKVLHAWLRQARMRKQLRKELARK